MNDELRLEHLAERLGASAAERLDTHAIAQQVLERLRTQPAERASWVQPAWLRIAAAVVILVGGGVLVGRFARGPRPAANSHAAHYVADDLNDLSATELRDVLSSFDDIISTGTVTQPDSGSDLHQLDTQQLREVLRSLEG